MRITESQLRKIVREEAENMREASMPSVDFHKLAMQALEGPPSQSQPASRAATRRALETLPGWTGRVDQIMKSLQIAYDAGVEAGRAEGAARRNT